MQLLYLAIASLLVVLNANTVRSLAEQHPKPRCINYNSDFTKTTQGWIADNSAKDTFELKTDGIQMSLVPPTQYVRLHDPKTHMPFNKIEGRGPTFNASSLIRFGRVSASIRSASVGGAITAFILIADNGDEIDFELLGGDPHHVQTNYFWGKRPLYTVNGGYHEVPGAAVYDDLHTYSIDWSPDRIIWAIDDKVVRVKTRNETCGSDGICKFPSSPARVQIGLWDGSFEPGTAEWSRGPIDWTQHKVIPALIKSIVVECHSEYNAATNSLPNVSLGRPPQQEKPQDETSSGGDAKERRQSSSSRGTKASFFLLFSAILASFLQLLQCLFL